MTALALGTLFGAGGGGGGTASLLTGAAGFALGSQRSKFRTPQLPSLSELTKQAVGSQRIQLAGAIKNQRDFGGQFLTSQIESQRAALPGFFEQTQAGIQQGEDLVSRLIGGDLERRLTTQGVRGAQAARGLTLGPASAIQEGLAVQQAQAQNELQAFGLRGQLAQLESATPFGVQTFSPGVSGLGDLTSLALGGAQGQAGLQAQSQAFKIQQADAARANQAGGFASLAGGFAGLEQFGTFRGFLQGAGFGATQKKQTFPTLGSSSNVSTTAGNTGTGTVPFLQGG